MSPPTIPRLHRAKVQLSPAEFEEIRRRAAIAGLSVSAYLRRVGLASPSTVRDHAASAIRRGDS